MTTPSSYKSLKDQQNLQSLLLLDDKGFVIYNSQPSKQHSSSHNYYELYQLSKYFYPEENSQKDKNKPVVVGIETGSHITMIRADNNTDGEERIIVMKQRNVDNTEGNHNL